MKVIIRQREESYESDYPNGWKFSAGDPFKFPVLIGSISCFVKKFEQKTPEDISGWDLLVKMTGKDQKNLSTVFDIQNVQENGKEIYYVFYECLDGITMDRYVREKNIDINLIHLKNDLFNALKVLQNYSFWFADFTEKNIFYQKDGTFVLVDVDSAQRITDLPVNEMYGSKDYWILVLKFYKEVLNISNIRLSDINGINLNYLQIPFLVLRLKIFLAGDREDYNSTALFNQLPARLDRMVPEFKDLFLKVIDNGKDPLSPEEINNIEDIVERQVIKAQLPPEGMPTGSSLPIINRFETNTSEIKSGGQFILSWQVENANKLELYKNGAMFTPLELNQKEVSLKEFADGTRRQSSYQLIAYKDLNMAKSDSVIINLKGDSEGDGTGVSKWVFIAGGVLLVVILGLVFFPDVLKNTDKDRDIGKNPPGVVDSVPPKDDQISDTTTNKPTADAGPSQSITLPKNDVILDGKAVAREGALLKYHWKWVAGPKKFIIGEPNASSTLVTELVEGTYTFRLDVIDDKGAVGSDDVQVNVGKTGTNIPPTASAGPDQTIRIRVFPTDQQVILTGSGTDADGNSNQLKYTWRQTRGPDFGTVIVSPFQATTTVRSLKEKGTYEFQLTVTDAHGGTASNIVRITLANELRVIDPRIKIRRFGIEGEIYKKSDQNILRREQ